MMRGLGLAVAGALLLCGQAEAATVLPYSSVIVFGDSLVDAGNAQKGSIDRGTGDPTPSTAGYYDGRFSNGPTFADDISRAITGQVTTAYLKGGSNFAVGGAPTVLAPGETGFGFAQQLGIFSALNRPIAADALVIVTFGGNDVRDTAGVGGDVSFDPAVKALRSGLEMLLTRGARNIVVTGLPDIGRIPETSVPDPRRRATPAELSTRSGDLNGLFRTTVQSIDAGSTAKVDFFDFLAFQRSATSDPASVGLPSPLNVTTPCIGSDRCGDSLFFDFIHPTAIAHQAVANSILAGIAAVPEPGTWMLLLAGTGLTGGLLRRRRGMLAPAT